MKSSLPEYIESISVRDFYESFAERLLLRLVTSRKTLSRSTIRERSLNRPALAVTGYFKYFASKRIQLFGAGEMGFLREQNKSQRVRVLEEMAAKRIPCVVISRNLAPTPEMIEVFERFGIPVFRTSLASKAFTTEVTVLLEERFAPRTTVHGTLLDIRGIGTLVRGDSGAGKSEAALALLERGHSLVADDMVRVKLLSDHTPVGFCDEMSRGFMECRGIGIINVEELFGIRFVRIEKKIELVVTFTEDLKDSVIDRTGLDRKTFEILGAPVPHMEIPLRTGRDMARLVEVAAMVQAARQLGHDSANDFNQKLIKKMKDIG
ncbi:MAG: HPr(Ser) kinase/phosphatase [Opitutae bacterium]|jgi:HPr kinase/phosphorylase|nr:HPr(Ser) kinase/phosphatase [Verrucomicrobiota bacterium]MDA0905317.1 HPr(Ser) kinase/phosphatase [Verrucomicrobiota bacterium]MDA1077981.1 HPr(Ser) kinase/phosphatase [Verrucomicrobiota bacterium]NDH00333.1 HPr(Ser) kinase/phosphatase [Opitutae bacterium]